MVCLPEGMLIDRNDVVQPVGWDVGGVEMSGMGDEMSGMEGRDSQRRG